MNTQYRQDERGRLFRWDAGLQAWFRIVSHDDEYDDASRAVRTEITSSGPAVPFAQVPRPATAPGSPGRSMRRGGAAPDGEQNRHIVPATSWTCASTGAAVLMSVHSSRGPIKQAPAR